MTDKKKQLLILGMLILINAAFSILPLSYDFVADDFTLIVQNERIQKFDNFIGTIGEKYFQPPHYPYLTYWRPVSLFSFFLDYQIWGPDPFGFHLTNALLHIFLIVALFCLLLILTHDVHKSGWLCLLYSVHPARADIASWISGRTDLLANLFILLTLLCFFLWRQNKHRYLYLILSFFCQIMALLAKEQAIVIPAALLLWLGLAALHQADGFKKALRGIRQLWLPIGLSLGLSMAFLLIHGRLTASGGILAKLTWLDIPLFFKTVGVYARMLFFPFFPTHYISIPMADFHASWLLPLFSFVAFAALMIWIMGNKPRFPLSLATLPFLLFMLPLCLISLIPSYPQLALRFASLGAIFVAAVIVDNSYLLKKNLRIILLMVLFITWGATFLLHQTGYQNNTAFYKRVVDNHPSELLSKRAYALELAHQKKYQEALALLDEILQSPNQSQVEIEPQAQLLKANLLVLMKKPTEAMALIQQLLNQENIPSPFRHDCLVVMAQVYEANGQLEEALQTLQQAQTIQPSADEIIKQGIVLIKLNRHKIAIELLESAKKTYPEHPEIQKLLALAKKLSI